MMKMANYFIVYFAITNCLLSYSQNLNWCGTSQAIENELKKDAAYAKKLQELDQFTQQYTFTNYKTSGTVYTIPIVFHIIHNYGAENISKEQVEDAVSVLNTDFRRLNEDTADVISAFKSLVADVEIEFKLATIDPDGNCTDGITRTVSAETFAADDNVKNLVQWDPSMYLNVWVVEEIESGAGGYSYYPGVTSWKDGIVIRNDQLGSIGTSGGSDLAIGSLTHEVGHYLNLKHTWGDNNSPGNSSNCSDDDDVSDTPNCAGTTTCNTSSNSCGYVENVQNYMDYSGCLCMFTEGQKTRMRAALNSSTGDRNQLWKSSNLQATGTYSTSTIELCTADFDYDNEFICAGNSVSFSDLSWNGDPTSWNWTFTGGTPSSSTDSAPTVTYSSAGEYSVTLKVSNSTGTVTTTKTNIIHVSSTSAWYGPDYTEDFENSSQFSSDWEVVNIDGSKAWSRSSSAAYEGTYALKMTNYGNTLNSVDEIISPSLDLSYITSPKLKFRLAYAQQTTDDNDVLKIYASADCGETWTLRYSKQGSSLTTTSTLYTSDFKPSSSQWEEHEVSFTGSLLSDNVRIKFQFTSDEGNNLYIDDMYISGTINGVKNVLPYDVKFNVTPNPVDENTIAKFYLLEGHTCSLSIYDVLGRETNIFTSRKLSEGEQSFSLADYINKQGVYFVKLSIGDKEYIKSVVK